MEVPRFCMATVLLALFMHRMDFAPTAQYIILSEEFNGTEKLNVSILKQLQKEIAQHRQRVNTYDTSECRVPRPKKVPSGDLLGDWTKYTSAPNFNDIFLLAVPPFTFLHRCKTGCCPKGKAVRPKVEKVNLLFGLSEFDKSYAYLVKVEADNHTCCECGVEGDAAVS